MSLSNKTLKSFQLPDLDNVYNVPEIADEYTSKKYDVGDYVNYQGVIYRCTTQISVAESWNGSHWTAVKIANDLRDNKNELTDLKSAITAELDMINLDGWESGGFNTTNGANYVSPTYIRNQKFVGLSLGTVKVICDNGCLMLPYAWDSNNTFIGSLKTSGVFDKTTSNYGMVSEFDCTKYPGYKIKMTMRLDPASESITTDDGAYCYFYNVTDKTLTKENKIPDSKIVGDKFSYLENSFDDKVNDKYTTINPTNWYNKDGFTLGILKANETIEESTSYKYTNYYIPVSSGDVIRFNRGDNFNGLYFRHVAAYDSNKNPLGPTYGLDASAMIFTIPSGVSFVRITVDVLNNMESLKPMITISDNAPTSYSAYFTPYEVISTDFVKSETAVQIAKIKDIEESMDALNDIKVETVTKHTTVNLFDGTKNPGYVATNGAESITDEHYHTNKIDVQDMTGETIKVYNNGTQSGIRFVCAYDHNNNVMSSAGSGSLSQSYTIPSGVAFIIMSFGINQFDTPFILITTGTTTLYIPKYDKWDINNYSPVDNAVNIPEPFVLTTDSLSSGKTLVDDWANSVKNRGTYVFSCKLSGTMTADNYIIVGKNGSNGYAVGVSGTQWAWFINNVNQGGSTHGLTLKDYLVIIIDKLSDGAHVTILTNGGEYSRTNTTFLDEHGSLYVHNISGITLTDVRCTWTSQLFRNRLWFFGDSYVSYSNKRWPYYIYDWGFGANILISGYPGETAEVGYKDFCSALRCGKPSIAAWLYGMNNTDNGAVNSSWLAYTQMFLEVCALYDIQPILATIPCVPNYDNSYKNAWVRSSGYRYIDFASAVNTVQDATTWFDSMLSSDDVHPDVQGAIALATQIIVDVPEILIR